ncbi:MAG: alpha/beta hydrolase [Woeseiaceae bacterium]|nr:alpha/beta hydrolase [Woeseiaceae bacterium]
MSNPDIYRAVVARRESRHRIRGVDYTVHSWGDDRSPLLVWLHGWGDCGSTAQFVVDALERDWHVIAPDWRGFGRTTTLADAFWFPDYLGDLDRLLDIYSPNAGARIVGHSMGANVAGLYAGTMTERVAAFVNVEGFGLRDSDPDDAAGRYRTWLEFARDAPEFRSFDDFEALADRVLGRAPAMTRARARFVAREWGCERDGRIVLRASPWHKRPNAVLYRRAESEACWRRIEAPVLLVAGRDSRVGHEFGVPLDSALSLLPFANAASAIIDGAGHMLHFEAPETLAARLEAFLAATL